MGTAAGPDLPCPGAPGSFPLSFRPAKVRVWESERALAPKRSRGGSLPGDLSCSLVLGRRGDAFASRGCGRSPAGPRDHAAAVTAVSKCAQILGGRSCRGWNSVPSHLPQEGLDVSAGLPEPAGALSALGCESGDGVMPCFCLKLGQLDGWGNRGEEIVFACVSPWQRWWRLFPPNPCIPPRWGFSGV